MSRSPRDPAAPTSSSGEVMVRGTRTITAAIRLRAAFRPKTFTTPGSKAHVMDSTPAISTGARERLCSF